MPMELLPLKTWLKALLSETILSIWWILSGVSTLSTFFVHSWSGKVRLALAIVTLLGFVLANLRVFQKQQGRISELNQALARHEARASQLRMMPDAGSHFMLRPVDLNRRRADFSGGVLEFHLMIENTGRRNSTVNDYQVEIVELGQAFPNLRPVEAQNLIPSRYANHGAPARVLSTTGNIRIDAESATDRGILLLFVPGLNIEQFAKAGSRMEGDDRRFGPLHCRLTVTDTMGGTAAGEFELSEA